MNEFINPGKLFIAVIGGSIIPPETAQIAEEVGREIALRGVVLVCGGLGGVMEAACRGATGAGGIAVVVSYQIDRIVRLMRMGWRAERMLDDGDA